MYEPLIFRCGQPCWSSSWVSDQIQTLGVFDDRSSGKVAVRPSFTPMRSLKIRMEFRISKLLYASRNKEVGPIFRILNVPAPENMSSLKSVISLSSLRISYYFYLHKKCPTNCSAYKCLSKSICLKNVMIHSRARLAIILKQEKWRPGKIQILKIFLKFCTRQACFKHRSKFY